MLEQIIITIIAVGLTTGLLVWSWILVLIQENKIKTLKQQVKDRDTTIQKLQNLNDYDVEKILQENEKLKFQITHLRNLRILDSEARATLNAENEKLEECTIQQLKPLYNKG